MTSLDPAQTAFIVVHLQNDIADEKGAFGAFFIDESRRNDTVGKAASLLGIARAAGASIFYVRVGFQPDYSDLHPNVPLLAMVAQFGAAVNGTWQTEILPAVAPAEGDVVLTHTRTSPFQGTDLDAQLRARGIENVVVLGIATNASVEDTARYATNLGYRVVLASDACSAGTEAAHLATLDSFQLLGETLTNAEIAEALAG
jgi:nicotinamidase-related amidase